MRLPKRKSPRLKEYDYSTPGYYFITVCTHNKIKIFSKIVGAIRESPLQSRQIIDKAIGYIKMNASKRIYAEVSQGEIWQRSFHDHIIRGEKDYQKIWQYIHCNSVCWKDDCFYME